MTTNKDKSLKIRVIQPSDWSFNPMDEFIAKGGEAFSVSRFGYELLKKRPEIDLDVVVPDYSKWFPKFISKILKLEGSNLVLQYQLIKLSKKYDVIYYSADRHPYLIAIARKIGICKAPILMLCHFSYDTRTVDGFFKKIALKLERNLVFIGIDKVIFNSENIMKLADEDYGLPLKHKEVSGWGADLDYFMRGKRNREIEEPYYFAAGGANRDYKTLILAFRKLPYKLIISCPSTVIRDEIPLPENIFHFDYKKEGLNAYEALRELYQGSKAVLIPILKNNHVANGASVFVEALACGKPILISNQNTNFLNVEKEGIGKKVKMWDVNDWIKQIEFMEMNPKLVKQMCEKAQLIARDRYNYEILTNKVLHNIKLLYNK